MDLGRFTTAKVKADFMDTMDVYDNKIITGSRFRIIACLSRVVT
jgi:hypothetical protein